MNSRAEAPAEYNREVGAYEQVRKLQRYRLAEGAEEEFDEDFVFEPCDLSQLASPDTEARAAAVAALGASLEDTGFAILTGHGVDPALYEEAHRRTKEALMAALFEEFGIASFREAASLDDEQRQALRSRAEEIAAQFPVTVADFVDHIDYAIDVMGLDHVAISSDFDGGGGVDGWDDASETLNVTIELVRRGYTEEEIRQLWSGNTLRILREAEQVAAEMQAAAGS